jgi:hypothetical protein
MSETVRHFVLTCHGLCATTWTSLGLAEHPEVFCCHGRSHPAEGVETAERLADDIYRRERLEFEARQMHGMLLPEYLGILRRAAGGKAVAGNVHGFVLAELRDKLLACGAKRPDLAVGNLVREPFAYTRSYTALVLKRRLDYPEKYEQHLARRTELMVTAHRAGLNGARMEDPRVFAFVEACWSLWGMTNDLEDRSVPHFRMEDLVADRDAFADMALRLTGRSYALPGLLERIFRRGKANSHQDALRILISERSGEGAAVPRPENDAARIRASWEEWQYRVFEVFCGERTIENFKRLGYTAP